MSDAFAVRTATLDDAAEIARLSAQLGYPADVAVFEARLRRLLASPLHAVLVAGGEPASAKAAGGLAGLIGLEQRITLENGERVEIVGLVVDAAARRGGVGRALVAAAERWTRERGLDTLFLRSNVVRPEAHAFYPGLGFDRSKTQHVYSKRV
ncbi:MAG TPA: GNAT family N-acetyltransferase [Luteimonas sp.]|nr:GNAT family N-acetyltransferase [Luteimonas sp.]